MEKIAKDPSVQFDLWILKTYNILPTDERFQKLTVEQRQLLFHIFLEEHPEIKNKHYDPEFDEALEQVERDSINLEDTRDISEKFEEFVKEHDLDDIEYSEEAKRILEQIKLKQIDDWEEIPDDDEFWND